MFKLVWNREEIDSFDTLKEAQEMRKEYNMAYGGGVYIKKGTTK